MPTSGRNALANCVQRVIVVGDESQDFVPQCFTDDSGTTFFGIWQLVDDVLTIEFFTVDAAGNTTPYAPTSNPVPCAPNDVESDSQCWIAVADGVGYSTGDQLAQWFFWDVTTTPPTLDGVSWYNQTTGATIAAAPPLADLAPCDAVTLTQIVPGYIESCTLVDVTTEVDAEGTFGEANPLISTLVTDAATESLIRNEVARALEAQREEEAKGIPVTTFIINTESAAVFEFLPSALIVNVVTGIMSFTTADVVSWPQPLVDTITNMQFNTLQNCVCENVEMVQQYNADGTLTLLGVYRPRVLDVDGNKEQIALPLPIGVTGPFSGHCVQELSDLLSVGYIQSCDPFDITLPINVEGTFSDALSSTVTLTSTQATITLIVDALRDALEYEEAEIENGLPVTTFIIRNVGGSIFEFPPSAFDSTSGTAITLTTADLVAWPGPLVDTIQRIEYSRFDNCDCQSVEMLQRITDGGGLELLKLVDPSIRDANGLKSELQLPLAFGVTGPFAGPCPAGEQVVSLLPLCCDDDLLANNPGIANQRLAWLDGADTALMLDAVGGVPIAGNEGDQVFEVQDKIAPGIAPSFVIPTAAPPGDTAPINPPTLDLDAINGLPVLDFDSANRERLRLDSNNGNGSSFTLFYLVSATDPVLAAHACILAVGPAGTSDGDTYDNTEGSWQLSRDGASPSFIFRLDMNAAEYALGVDPPMIVQTGPFSNESGPTNPLGTLIERAIATEAEFFDGQIHLITVQFDNATGILSAFFDGDLRMAIDFSTFPLTTASIGSDYFRLFGNRVGTSFLSGRLAEIFFADAVLTPEETSIVNAYLICKWSIDPSLAAGGAGDLTLAPGGTYSNPTALVQITRADGTVVYRNTDTGLEFPVPPVPGLSVCDAGEACCEQTDLNFAVGVFTAPSPNANFPANTINSLSIDVQSGTADLNGVILPAGTHVNFNGDSGQNNIATAFLVSSFTGTTVIVSGQY